MPQVKKNRTRGLGSLQRNVLSSLIEYKGWQVRCGWVWDTQSNTKKILDSLVTRGFVRCEDGFYTPIQDEKGNEITTTVTRN
jgi:hypothetical protein